MQPRAILFDFDGTLVQTRELLWTLFKKTNDACGLGITSQEQFLRLFEDNVFDALRNHCSDAQKGDAAAAHYLALLDAEYAPQLAPGMRDVIKTLANICPLAIVSSNSVATIRRILTAENVSQFFAHVFGCDVDKDKRDSIRRFLSDSSYLGNRTPPQDGSAGGPSEISGNEIVVVTDTVGDVKHARECGVRIVGVAWGMHTEQQLSQAGVEFVALWPQELVSHFSPENGSAAQRSAAPEARPPPSGEAATLQKKNLKKVK
jgi:phosphoglycolate phosphatase